MELTLIKRFPQIDETHDTGFHI